MASNDRIQRRTFGAGRKVEFIGLEGGGWRDAYHTLLNMSWRLFFALVFLGYLAINAAFALGYAALGDAIESARPGSFADAFFFSVQTLATIGYGKMVPRTLGANLLVSAEALLGMVGLAVTTGLVFARFSRSRARVLFSRQLVVCPWDGVPSLMFRMANARGSQIAEARLKVTFLREEETREGERVRKVHELKLARGESSVFALTWLVIHPITPESPLHGQSAETLAASGADLIVSLTGLDDGLGQTVSARHFYGAEQIRWNARLVDILTVTSDGRRIIDYRRFHDWEPLP